MLDGLSSIESYISECTKLQFDALAITDHGNMHGCVELYNAAKSAGIHPVMGVEFYSTPFGVDLSDRSRNQNHLLLLAENQIGYSNLLLLSRASFVDGLYYKPRISTTLLEQHSAGLIATSGCMAAYIPEAIQEGNFAQAEKMVQWYKDVFGNRFFIELQSHPGIPELDVINRTLLEYSKRYNIKCIITNDAHYAKKEDAIHHDVLLCVQTKSALSDPKRFKFTDNEYYLKSPEEMKALFLPYIDESDVEQYMVNTYELAHSCNASPALDIGTHMPIPEVNGLNNPDEFLRELVYANVSNIYPNWEERSDVKSQIEEELAVIAQTKFASYFILIWDICSAANKKGIIYNTRGSAAGSIINYIIGVSFVDPLENGLMFSRFLNQYRVSIPDCDLDFEDDRREEMMMYIVEKYGDDRVAQVVTFNHMKARASVRDVGRVLGIPLYITDLFAKSIKNTPGKPINLHNSIDQTSEYYSEDFAKYVKENDSAKQIYQHAIQLENKVRQGGIHAAAVLIGDIPLVNRIPLMVVKKAKTKLVSQLDYPTAESIGMLKVDLLGLITLRIIRTALSLINQRHNKQYNINNIPYMEQSSFDLLGTGNTIGVFQVENSGLTRYLVQMRPETFGQIADMISLYRPGPIGYIPDYINRLHGLEERKFKHPLLKEITENTQGIMIYQEQVNQVFMQLAGYHAGKADKMRKNISKKNVAEIEAGRTDFVKGCAETNQIDAKTANAIYDDINEFALYGFNRAHAASYARITLITAWIKSNYPVEYLTACLQCDGTDNGKRTKYIQDAIRNNIKVLPPQIGGNVDFSIDEKNNIVFGISFIDGIGDAVAEKISKATPTSIFEVGLKKNQLERLVQSGMFDIIGDRQELLHDIEHLEKYAKRYYRWMRINQRLMFYPKLTLSGNKEKLYNTAIMEYEAIGAWLTYHPLQIISQSKRNAVTRIDEIEEYGSAIVVVTSLEELTTKKGQKMYKFVGIDEFGSKEILVNSKLAKQFALKNGMILHVTLTVDSDESTTAFANGIVIMYDDDKRN